MPFSRLDEEWIGDPAWLIPDPFEPIFPFGYNIGNIALQYAHAMYPLGHTPMEHSHHIINTIIEVEQAGTRASFHLKADGNVAVYTLQGNDGQLGWELFTKDEFVMLAVQKIVFAVTNSWNWAQVQGTHMETTFEFYKGLQDALDNGWDVPTLCSTLTTVRLALGFVQ